MPNADPQSQIQPLRFAAECADFWRSLRELFGDYRPERHYMRGPGPKWHAKHKRALVEHSAAVLEPVPVRLTADFA
jgi:hypothetical protein